MQTLKGCGDGHNFKELELPTAKCRMVIKVANEGACASLCQAHIT